jgi:RNA-directed DNA polymerase
MGSCQRDQGYSRPPTAPRVNPMNDRTSIRAPRKAKRGNPPSPERSRTGGGASVVVGARESRAHGEGGQSTGTVPASPGKATYVAPASDRRWLLNVQGRLYRQSWKESGYMFRKLWGFVTDPRNLRVALARVARNKGRRTAGVDGVTVGRILNQVGAFRYIGRVRGALRSGAYKPSPVRRVLIPKVGLPGKFRPLGIPTVTDRVIQAAVKNILEPIFEADFYPSSFGFRPGQSAHAALEYIRRLLLPRVERETGSRLPYQWAVEGDIKGCFDNIDHHGLMNRVRRRIGDGKVLRLISAFLRAGIMSQGQVRPNGAGTPQGGILSPLLANIALCAIEEKYEHHAWPRHEVKTNTVGATVLRAMRNRAYDRSRGLTVRMPVRYADDFIVFVCAPQGPAQDQRAQEISQTEKADIAAALRAELGLELSESKTLVTPVTQPIRFLGHHVRVRRHPDRRRKKYVSTTLIPRDRSHLLRERIKRVLHRSTTWDSLANRLKYVNMLVRGWCYYYRHAWGASRVFSGIDHYVWWTIFRWLKKKHQDVPVKELRRRYGWRRPGGTALRWGDGDTRPFEASTIQVQPFRMEGLNPVDFSETVDGEPGA